MYKFSPQKGWQIHFHNKIKPLKGYSIRFSIATEAPTTISPTVVPTEATTLAQQTTPAPAFVMPEVEVNTSFLGGRCSAGIEETTACMQLCIDQGCYGIDWK